MWNLCHTALQDCPPVQSLHIRAVGAVAPAPSSASLFMQTSWIVYTGLWKQYCKLVYNKQFPSGTLHHNKAQMGRRELAVGAQQPQRRRQLLLLPLASAAQYNATASSLERVHPDNAVPARHSQVRQARVHSVHAHRPRGAALHRQRGVGGVGSTAQEEPASRTHTQLAPRLLRDCCKPSATALTSTPPAPTAASASAAAGFL